MSYFNITFLGKHSKPTPPLWLYLCEMYNSLFPCKFIGNSQMKRFFLVVCVCVFPVEYEYETRWWSWMNEICAMQM